MLQDKMQVTTSTLNVQNAEDPSSSGFYPVAFCTSHSNSKQEFRDYLHFLKSYLIMSHWTVSSSLQHIHQWLPCLTCALIVLKPDILYLKWLTIFPHRSFWISSFTLAIILWDSPQILDHLFSISLIHSSPFQLETDSNLKAISSLPWILSASS